MGDFDKRLLALADCPVMEGEEGEGGGMVFNPYPVISAEDDFVLAHEVCHVLAGRKDYDIFATALEARKVEGEIYKHILNMMYDWYHEYLYGRTSGFLWGMLTRLHQTVEFSPTGIDILDAFQAAYLNRNVSPQLLKKHNMIIRDTIDLVALADLVYEGVMAEAEIKGIGYGDLVKLLGGREEIMIQGKKGRLGGPKSDIGIVPERSNYYIRTVARYRNAIEELSKLWKRNRYGWQNSYFGEINWRNLTGMFIGSEIGQAVWRLFMKIVLSRKIFLVIDRSGSTEGIKEMIMDTAIIIAESLRCLNIPISVLDVGVTHAVVNEIDSPLDLGWFTPMADDGTPLGEVISTITKADPESYLLVITDGQPNDWDKLVSALNHFPGTNLTMVIGESYSSYLQKVKNTIHVEPHTIIRELIYDSTLS